MPSHCPCQLANSEAYPSFPFTLWPCHCLSPPGIQSSIFFFFFFYPCSLNTEGANYSDTPFSHLSLSTGVVLASSEENKNVTLIRTSRCLLDVPTCAGICSGNGPHVKQLCCIFHSQAGVPPNTLSVNWSLGSVGSPDSASQWPGWGLLGVSGNSV